MQFVKQLSEAWKTIEPAVAEALAHAHSRLIVHRDVKPDDDDGTHTLLAFGKLLDAARDIIGQKLPNTAEEQRRWEVCVGVLSEELRSAAARAGTVSSVPAFFAEHLRRAFSRTRQDTKPVSHEATEPPVEQFRVPKSLPSSARLIADEVSAPKSKEPRKQVAEITQTQQVRKSAYPYELWLEYAAYENKRSQGMISPKAVAIKAFETGDRDYLMPAYVASKEGGRRLQECPDCEGRGLKVIERDGQEGVIKCNHERLNSA